MKKINNLVSGVLVVILAFASVVLPSSKVFAVTDNISLPGTVDARSIITNGTTNYISDLASGNLFAVDFPTVSSTNSVNGDGALGLYFSNSNLFVAAGKYSPAVVCFTIASSADVLSASNIAPCIPSPAFGGLQVFASSDLSTPLSVYGNTDFTYSKVAVSSDTAFAAYFDNSNTPKLDPIGATTFPLLPTGPTFTLDTATDATDITGISISGNYAFVSIAGTDGIVNVVDISNPAAMVSVGTYSTSDPATAVTSNGSLFYVGHGNSIDVVETSDLSSSTIDTGAQVNGLSADDNGYVYAATDAGLKVYKLVVNSLVLVGEFNTTKNATAVSVDGAGNIYLATSDGTNSEIFKIKMVAITLNKASNGTTNPQAAEFGTTYEDPGAMVDGVTKIYADDTSVVHMNSIGDYTVTYTSGDLGLSLTRTVQVRDTIGPVITLVGLNPQKIRHGLTATYSDIDPGATTDDGSPVTKNYSDFTDKNGTYYITYDAVDESGNHAIQVVREVIVGPTIIGSGGGGGGSSGGNGGGISGNGGGENGNQTPGQGQVLGAEKFIFTMFLKMGHPLYPTGAYANEVMELQKFLNTAPHNSGLVVDGKFGPLTKAAVVKFQLANNLVGDGLVGPLTRAVLNK